ncbi:Trk system potassium uptake protein TrkA [bacterium HR16]|nr:Trk system potassium uptake protein TrkA [bacterium HR16]
MYIIIVGAGNVGYYLAKTLLNAGHEVLLIERDKRRCDLLRDEFGESVMRGRGDEIRTMREAGADSADIVVACTGDDEDNLIISQIAKWYFNVPRTVARINDPRNESIFQQLGIDATVSSTNIIYHLIEQEIEAGEVIPLAALKRGNIEIVDVELSTRSPVVGKRVQDLPLPPDALIVCIIRQENAMLPHGDTVLEANDSVIALVSAQNERQLRKVFAEEQEE